jgi:hypothetical protein
MNSLSDLNGVTFGAGTFGSAQMSGGYYNDLQGTTDVVTGVTDPTGATGYTADVAAITGGGHFGGADGEVDGNFTIQDAVQYTAGDGHYIAPTATTFATFGYLTFNGSGGDTGGDKYFVHGFSSSGALLLSSYQTLTLDEVNGTTYLNGDPQPQDARLFEVLSNYDLDEGAPGAAYYPGHGDTTSWTDTAGIYHKLTSKYHDGSPYQPGYTAQNGNYYAPRAATPGYSNISGTNAPNGNIPGNATPITAPQSYPLLFTNDESVYNTPPCYAEGTRVLTVRGEVAVEDLEVGDEAVTASGGTRPVIWIGSRRVRCDIHPNPAEVNPVRIRKGAFGEGLPVRDLVVSPGHAVFVDGVLIPAHALVNGATVVQEAMDRVRYFHVELDAHDVLLAEGLPCESYLDDGNRTTFGNSPEFTALHGRLDPKSWEHACAPMVAAGPQLAEVQRRLLARAEAMGWTRVEAPDLHLMADGVAIAPVMAKANRFWFAAPVARELALASASSTLAHTLPGVTDARRLGVAVSELKLDGQPLDLTGHALGQGFHALETHGEHAWRWTDGEGRLALTLAEPAMLEVALLMVSPTWKRPAANLRLVQAG